MNTKNLIATFPIISDQINKNELLVIVSELEKVLAADSVGSVVEFGCYVGTTSLFIQRMLQQNREKKSFHVYDSFAGLPEKHAKDQSVAGDQFVAGKLLATKTEFIRNFKRANLPLPIIHKGWFQDFSISDVPEQICFAFLDGDYYESIEDSLRLIERKLVPGAVLIVDDYASEALPGAAKAVDEWLKGKSYKLRIQSSLAVIQC